LTRVTSMRELWQITNTHTYSQGGVEGDYH